MKKRFFIILILAVVCMVVLGVTIYTKKQKNVITENGVETYYTYKETELGTELNQASENYVPTESTTEELEAASATDAVILQTEVSVDRIKDRGGVVKLSVEDAAVIVELIENGLWAEGNCRCADDCIWFIGGEEIQYSSDGGTFNDRVNGKYLDLTEDQQAKVNTILREYGVVVEENMITEIASVSGENQTEEPIVVNPDELANIFGISISLPENPNWIVNSEYHLIDDNNLEITYYDPGIDSDCVILVAKNEALVLPENEYDERLNESWEGWTINGQHIVVKVQRGKNGSKAVLATWEYNEYRFAIIGEIEGELDSGPIAKVALNIINNLN